MTGAYDQALSGESELKQSLLNMKKLIDNKPTKEEIITVTNTYLQDIPLSHD